MTAPKIYFGHPKNSYNTHHEQTIIRSIKDALPKYEIVNPNERIHQEGYDLAKKLNGPDGGMEYFYKEVLPTCSAGIFLPFPDETWGSGVYAEAMWFLAHDLPIGIVTYQSRVSFPIEPIALKYVVHLSIEETRIRVKKPYLLTHA